MEFRILGPFDVVMDGETVLLGSGRQRALLVLLLLNANHAVSIDRLVDELWGGEPPGSAVKAIQTYVSRLRKVLPGGLLITRPPGYVVEIEPEQLDLHLFERALGEGQRRLAAGEPAAASTALRRALELWRGPALVEFASQPFARSEGPRLEELRLVAVEERIEADLLLGRHADLVGELESLVAHHPLRERFRGQLMVALYRSGRQAEALAAYRDARSLLVDELGLEPGRSLQELEQTILRHDPSLDLRPATPLPDEAPTAVDAAQVLGGFVGREHELERLRDALDGAISGEGRLVMLSGEPGIGKTRIATELAGEAGRRGVQVLWGRCYEREGAPPYWPWVQAIRAHVDRCDSALLRSEVRGQVATIAEIVPEIAERLPDLEPPPAPPDPKEARFRLLDSVASFLRRASQAQPLMVVLDDLHGADAGSLLLLEFVARQLAGARLLLVGTYLDVELARGDPLADTLAELTRERLFERLSLRGLAEEEVARFLEATAGRPPPPELARAVHRQAEGNPLFMTEVVRLLGQDPAMMGEEAPGVRDWSLRLPEGVKQVIGRRLDRLSGDCNEMLRLASVIGREFSLIQLSTLVDLADDELLALLEEALAAHVLEELPDSVDSYRFAHMLIRDTLVGELSTTRRVRLHARLAGKLEEVYGDEVGTHAVELAHHFGEAEAVLGPGKLVRYSLVAGESALAAHAPEQALSHFERALAAKGDGAMDDETAVLLFGLARAQLATLAPNELEPAVTSLRRAFEYYAQAGDTGHAVAVVAYSLPLSLGMGQTKMAELIARGLTLVPPDSREEGQLLAWHGWFSGFTEADYDAARRAFQSALAIAGQQEDLALERRTLAYAAFVDAFHLRWQQCLARGLRAIELTQHAGDLHDEMTARRAVAWAFAATGKGEQARVHTAAALEHAERLRESWWLTSTSFSNELLCLYQGDWRAAREMSELGLAAQPRDPRHLALRAALGSELGDHNEAAECVARLQEVAESAPPPGPIADSVFLAILLPLVGRIANTEERLDVAVAAAERLLSLPRLAPVLAANATSGLALTAVQRGDAAAAKRLYAAVEGQRGTASFFVPLTTDRLLGLLAVTFGQVDMALAHFENGLAFCERAGYRPEYAWTASDYADALLRRAGADDRARAFALRDEAQSIARELAMQPLIDRVRASADA